MIASANNVITLVFSTRDDPESWAIRRGTDSRYSHLDARMPEGGLLGARFSANGGPGPGVQIRPEGYLTFSRTLTLTIPTPLADSFYAALREQIGKPYDWRAVVAFVGDQDRDFRDDDAWFCDELDLAMAEKVGLFFGHALPTPAARVPPGGSLLAFGVLPGVTWVEWPTPPVAATAAKIP